MEDSDWATVEEHLDRILTISEMAEASDAGLQGVIEQVQYARKDIADLRSRQQ